MMRNNAMKPLLLLFSGLLLQALCEDTPPPLDVHVDKGQLTWSRAAENATYTVEYRRRRGDKWEKMPACVQIPSSSCNVSSIRNEEELGCVGVRVRAERGGQRSPAVEACSHHGESCSPDFSLTPGPGSMSIRTLWNSSFVHEYASHGKLLIHFGKEGQLEEYGNSEGSVTIRDLEEGKRYCAQVQYVYMHKPVGPPRCIQCETTLVTSARETVIIAVVVTFVFLIIMGLIISYVIIFHFKKIKQMMWFPYKIPNLLSEVENLTGPKVQIPASKEDYDRIDSITQEDCHLDSPVPLNEYEQRTGLNQH